MLFIGLVRRSCPAISFEPYIDENWLIEATQSIAEAFNFIPDFNQHPISFIQKWYMNSEPVLVLKHKALRAQAAQLSAPTR